MSCSNRPSRSIGKFAPAYVGLASAYLNQQTLEHRPIGAIAADVQPLLQRAAQLRPNLAELYAVRGTLAMQLMRTGRRTA